MYWFNQMPPVQVTAETWMKAASIAGRSVGALFILGGVIDQVPRGEASHVEHNRQVHECVDTGSLGSTARTIPASELPVPCRSFHSQFDTVDTIAGVGYMLPTADDFVRANEKPPRYNEEVYAQRREDGLWNFGLGLGLLGLVGLAKRVHSRERGKLTRGEARDFSRQIRDWRGEGLD